MQIKLFIFPLKGYCFYKSCKQHLKTCFLWNMLFQDVDINLCRHFVEVSSRRSVEQTPYLPNGFSFTNDFCCMVAPDNCLTCILFDQKILCFTTLSFCVWELQHITVIFKINLIWKALHQCSVSRWRPHKVDKCMVLEYTHGLFIT